MPTRERFWAATKICLISRIPNTKPSQHWPPSLPHYPLVALSEWGNFRQRLDSKVEKIWVRDCEAPSFGCVNEKRSLGGKSIVIFGFSLT